MDSVIITRMMHAHTAMVISTAGVIDMNDEDGEEVSMMIFRRILLIYSL